MGTPKMKARVPKDRSMRDRYDQMFNSDDPGHLQMGPIKASAETPTFKPSEPAGRRAKLEQA
jgi:hypothetical protein